MEELKHIDKEIKKIEMEAKDLYDRLYTNSDNVTVYEIMEGIMSLRTMEMLKSKREEILVRYN